MTEKPTPTPEGKLIQAAIKRAGLSARKAADRAGISEGRWRQIASGYQVAAKGTYIPVVGPPDTVAAMAHVAGVTPEQLAEAGRKDAAEELRGIAPSGGADPLTAPEGQWDGELIQKVPLEGDEELRWRDRTEGGRLFQYRSGGFEHTATLDTGTPPEEAVLLLRAQLAKRIHRMSGVLMDRPQKSPREA